MAKLVKYGTRCWWFLAETMALLAGAAAPVPELLKTRVEKDNAARSCAMTRYAPLHSTWLVGGKIELERRGAPAPNGLLLC